MSTPKKSAPGFTGESPAAIDHRNPPAPLKPAPEQARQPDHFRRTRPEAIDPTRKAAPSPTAAKKTP